MRVFNAIMLTITAVCIILTAFLFKVQDTATDEELLASVIVLEQKNPEINIEENIDIDVEENIKIDSTNNEDSVENTEKIEKDKNKKIPEFFCIHKTVDIKNIAPTCTTVGEEKVICVDCKEILYEKNLEKIPHQYATKTIEATCTKAGETYDVCEDCGEKINIKTLNPKPHITKEITVKNSTCTTNGEVQTRCTLCNLVFNSKIIPAKNHNWTVYSETNATPLEDGLKLYKCTNKNCTAKKEEKTVFTPVGTTNLYIPSISFNKEVTLADCNQSNTDKYDICCDLDLLKGDNPVFFGHNTRSFSQLYKIKVGDIIYFTVNGKTSAYKVTISEKATVVNGGTEIRGFNSEVNLLYNDIDNSIRFFTCYYDIFTTANRWMIIAEKI